jgi:EamA domain-containing membrane protein RarD
VKVNALIAVVFVLAVVLERGNQDKDAQFWVLVGAGVVAVVGLATFLRSRGGIGATGD